MGIGFPRGLARVASYPAGTGFGPRTLADYELVWILSGDVRWIADGAVQDLGPEDLVLARPGMRDQFIWDPKRGTSHAFLHFTLERPGSLLPAPRTWPVRRRLSTDDPVSACLRYLLWLAPRPEAEAWTRRTLELLLSIFVAGPLPGDAAEPSLSPPTQAALAWLRAEWASGGVRAFPLRSLAEAAGVSREHLSRRFVADLGLPPVASVELIRLSAAAALMARTELSVGQVADQAGFSDPYHFSRRFRALFGAPPTAYRSADSEPAPLRPGAAEALRRMRPVLSPEGLFRP